MYQDGTGHYRMYRPAMMIKKLGLADVVVNPFRANKPPKNTWTDLEPKANGKVQAFDALAKVLGNPKNPKIDAVVFQRMDTLPMLSVALGIRKTYNIPIIQENDDYVWDVPNTNPGSLEYRERNIENQADANDPFMVARRSLGVYDSYITTTPFLQEFFGNYSPTYICPNSVDINNRKAKPRKGHKGFRIMFSSSAGHMENLELIKKPITEILKKYPNTTFYQYKHMPQLFKGTDLEHRVKTMDWREPDKYWQYLESFEPDICLAPLTDRLYNRGKSNLRLLEYWSSGNNAVIASPVGHYKDTIKDGVNGIFAKQGEWAEKIEYLMENPSVREKIAKGGYETVKKDYNLETNARKWTDAVKSTIDNYDPDKQAPDQYIAPEDREITR